MRICAKGDRVVQPTYGPGTVTEANERRTTIDFDAHGVRVFATELVRLSPTDEPAPARRKGRAKAVRKPADAA
ncbi:MAG: DUF3553 domain-containing protein [Acidobacteria bacterium]|nr:MAG: DUF3553 domain-containing protein [Acidobacteriota bacterium]